MEEIRRFTFETGRSAERLDRFLADSLPELTRSQVKKLIDDGRVLRRGAPAKAGERLKGGETLVVTLPEAVPAEALPEEIPLRVLYEDRHLIVIDKPAGVAVHGGSGISFGVIEALRAARPAVCALDQGVSSSTMPLVSGGT